MVRSLHFKKRRGVNGEAEAEDGQARQAPRGCAVNLTALPVLPTRTLFSPGQDTRGFWRGLCAGSPFAAELSRMSASQIKGSDVLGRTLGQVPCAAEALPWSPRVVAVQVTCDRRVSSRPFKSKMTRLTFLFSATISTLFFF